MPELGEPVTRDDIAGGWVWGVFLGNFRFAHRFALHAERLVLVSRCGGLAPRRLRPDQPLPLTHADGFPHCGRCERFP